MTKPTKWQVRPVKFRTTVKPVQLQDPQPFALNEMQKNSLSGIKILKIEPQHDKTNKVACASSEDSDQSGHPHRLIRVFAIHLKKPGCL